MKKKTVARPVSADDAELRLLAEAYRAISRIPIERRDAVMEYLQDRVQRDIEAAQSKGKKKNGDTESLFT